jgi:hypothetical protein
MPLPRSLQFGFAELLRASHLAAAQINQTVLGASDCSKSTRHLRRMDFLKPCSMRRDFGKANEYVVQSNWSREDGTQALPGVIIHLPEGRSLVIDSKVSLVAYEEFAVTENEVERTAARKRHMESTCQRSPTGTRMNPAA